jgi:hypothetical protein
MTNMEAAILKLAKTDADAVFLLTDGHVNQGSIQSPVGLSSLLRQCVSRKVAVHTLGYGSDHNVTILKTIALDTRGTYTFADTDELIPKTVGSIVGGLRDAVASDVSLSWAEGDELTCLEPGWSKRTDAHQYFVGSVLESSWILFSSADPTSTPAIKLQWSDGSMTKEVECTWTAAALVDREVEAQWIRIQSVKLFDKIHAGAVGAEMMAKLLSIESQIDAIPDRTPFLMCLYAQIQEMKAHLDRIHANPILRANNNMYRLASNMTTMTRQQGILSTADPSNDADLYTSPTQRSVRSAMVARFSQTQTE